MNICFFIDKRGRAPVKEFIEELTQDEQTKALAYIEELKRQGHNLRRPIADYVKDGVYELRPKANRLFFFFFLRENAVLVHAIKKKTDKIPENEVKVCIRRKKFIEQSGANIVRE